MSLHTSRRDVKKANRYHTAWHTRLARIRERARYGDARRDSYADIAIIYCLMLRHVAIATLFADTVDHYVTLSAMIRHATAIAITDEMRYYAITRVISVIRLRQRLRRQPLCAILLATLRCVDGGKSDVTNV